MSNAVCYTCTSRGNLLSALILWAVEAKREKNNVEDGNGKEESILSLCY